VLQYRISLQSSLMHVLRLEGARIHTFKDIIVIFDVFTKHNHSEVDTGRLQAGGTCEEVLREAKWQDRGILREVNLYPTAGKGREALSPESYIHSTADIQAG
jgi:aflatoxin B1 aldehyde reductase